MAGDKLRQLAYEIFSI